MSKNDYKKEREEVSKLIYGVLTEKLCVREALLKFPPDTNDKSIKAAYHSLVHFEADEDLRKRDFEYKEEQVDYLEFIAYILQNGEKLPDNIISSYEKYYKDTNITVSKGMKGLLNSLCKFLNV